VNIDVYNTQALSSIFSTVFDTELSIIQILRGVLCNRLFSTGNFVTDVFKQRSDRAFGNSNDIIT